MTAKKLDVPFVFTESGTDTLATEHKLPSVMWSQEYQDEYLSMNFGVFASYDFVQGELVWNFADFQTTEGIMRVNGNKKGIFTRQRNLRMRPSSPSAAGRNCRSSIKETDEIWLSVVKAVEPKTRMLMA